MSPRKILMFAASFLLICAVALFALGVPSVASAQGPTDTPTPQVDAAGKISKVKDLLRELQAFLRATDLRAGIVMTNTDGALTLRVVKGTLNVPTNSSTLVVIAGKPDGKLSDIAKGNLVVVKFPGNDATKPASFVMAFQKGFKLNELRLGTVIGERNDHLALRTRKGNEAVNAQNASLIDLTGDAAKPGKVSDLKRGNAVLVIGEPGGKLFKAQTILLLDQDARDLLNKIKSK